MDSVQQNAVRQPAVEVVEVRGEWFVGVVADGNESPQHFPWNPSIWRTPKGSATLVGWLLHSHPDGVLELRRYRWYGKQERKAPRPALRKRL